MREGRPVIIVSRNPDVREAYVLSLRAEGATAIGVSSCEEAIAQAADAPVCAVLYDVERQSDWRTLAHLRDRLRASVPVVVLSGWISADRAYRARAQEIGCAGFVAKPCRPAVIAEALENAAKGQGWTEYVDRSG